MGATSSKTKEAVIKTKVRAVGKLSYVRKQSNARRAEQDELRRRRGEAISVFEDSSEGDISREDITSLPLKNGGQVSDGERNEAFSVTDISSTLDGHGHGENEETRKPGLSLNDFKRVTRKKTLDEADAFFTVPYDTTERVVSSDHCHVCEVFTGHEVYPCRICGRAFHKSCLQKLGRCQTQQEVGELHSARTILGWSCYYCDDLSNLLTEEELSTLMETFDLLDVNKDSSLSREEFLRFYDRKDEKGDSSVANLTEAELKFTIVDRDKSGTISWSEFLNCETIFMLQRRNKSTLVPILSGNERDLARQVFKQFDTDHDETITLAESQAAFELWYSLFYTSDGIKNGYAMLTDTDGLQTYFKNKMEGEEIKNEDDETNENNGSVVWEEFIKDMAIHAITMRPNKCQIPVGRLEWLRGMITRINKNMTAQESIPEEQEDDTKSDSSGLSNSSINQLL